MSEDGERILVISNFTPVPHEAFRLGVTGTQSYSLLLNTDDEKYAGSGYKVLKSLRPAKVESEGLPQSVKIRIPPLSTLFYKRKG